MNSMVISAFSIGIAVFPGLAMAWQAWNRHDMRQVSNGVFGGVGRPGSGAADYWCAAGDYAYGKPRSAGVRRVYIHRGAGPSASKPGHKAMQFSLMPPAGARAEPAARLSMRRAKDNMRAAAARQYCVDFDPVHPFSRRP